MKKLKIAFGLNLVLVVSVIAASAWMMSGFSRGALSNSGWGMLKLFTVDSNLLLGIVAAIAAVDEWRVITGKKEQLSRGTYLLKLMGTAGVTLTMLVTVFFLTPTTYQFLGLFGLFTHANFFLHLFNPVLAIVAFCAFEKTDCLSLKSAAIGLVPLLVYSVYYVGEAVTHSHNGIVDQGYDWYHFFFAGLQSAVIVVPVVLLVMFAISAALWRLNRAKG